MAELVARSAVEPAAPVGEANGWAVSTRRSSADLRLADHSPLAKVHIKASADGRVAAALGVGHRRAARDAAGVLVVGSAPGEWLLIAEPGSGPHLAAGVMADPSDGELVSAIDVTHGRTVLGLRGRDAAALLAKLCTVNLADRVTPDGAAFRSAVAGVPTLVVRDDRGGEPAYLLVCERDLAQFLHDAVLDAGQEFGIDVDGFG